MRGFMLSVKERLLLQSAQSGDKRPFSQLVEPYRYELQVHSYRLLGSALDAEDAIQETFLRAWTKLDTFKKYDSLRAWLYKIATNVSLNILKKKKRKSEIEAEKNPTPLWLEPIPDEWLDKIDKEQSPESQFIAKEKVHLAFITLLQVLPPRQRVVFTFRDVLNWQAKEVAEILDISVSSVNSLLHRARTQVTAQKHIPSLPLHKKEVIASPLLERYIHAWESANIDDFVALLVEDATLTMPPLEFWFSGKAAIRQFLQSDILAEHSDTKFRCKPIQANRQLGFAIYQWDDTKGVYQALTIQIVTTNKDRTQVIDIVSFFNQDLFRLFGLSRTYPKL
jgi:RNA polymerase sigma-70 factor, ECF subfamily